MELQVHVGSIIVLVSRHLLDDVFHSLGDNRVFNSLGDNRVFNSWGDDFLHFHIRSLDH